MPTGDEISPGEEGKLQVNLRSKNRRRRVRQAVTIKTNVPEQAVTKFSVTANVLVDLEVSPNLLRFEKQQSEVASVNIKNHSKTPVQLSDIHSSSKYVDLSVSSMIIPSKGEVTVTAKLLPNIPQGIFSGWATLRTNLKSVPIIQVRMWGQIQ